ncbi:hypothetical protein ADL08_32630 [Streptomyces sp. NRRL F-6492]|nr:hypothetical protein ADL08_32630 [Streptomyces sp. NRRL F-6492]
MAVSTCGIAAVLLFVGASAHVADLLRHGLRPYVWAPGWLNLYWSPLALFDVLAAVFPLRGGRRGIDLACAVMATDLAANWYAAHGLQHSTFAAQPGLRRPAAFAVIVLGPVTPSSVRTAGAPAGRASTRSRSPGQPTRPASGGAKPPPFSGVSGGRWEVSRGAGRPSGGIRGSGGRRGARR